MSTPLKAISFVAILLVTVPCVLYFFGALSHDAVLSTALVGTVLWFAATPFWMGREGSVDADQVEI